MQLELEQKLVKRTKLAVTIPIPAHCAENFTPNIQSFSERVLTVANEPF
jgi:hypothetical protein